MLEARDISFAHEGSSLLYSDFNFVVKPDERVALVAPSGYGKTTLCRLLSGYVKPCSGGVFVDGQPLLLAAAALRQGEIHCDVRHDGADARGVLPHCGVGRPDMLHRIASYGATLGRNAARNEATRSAHSRNLPCAVQLIGQHPERALDPRMRMCNALAEAGITCPDENALVQDLGIRAEWLARFPHELSGGELQRFCIARALAVRPRYLVADEITTMLDAVTQARIWDFLLSYTKAHDMGLVFVSHSPALTARIATRVVDLADVR